MRQLGSVAFAAALVVAAGSSVAQNLSPEQEKKLLVEKLQAQQAPTPAQPATPGASTGGTITFKQSSIDFGSINDDKAVAHEFEFTNTGTGTLIIQQVQGSCGCTVPALQKREYLPGEGGKIKVEYNPHNRRGKQHTTVTVTSNDIANQTAKLDIHSTVIPQIQMDPPIINFGNVDRGTEVKQTVTVSSRNPELKVLEATSNSPSVSVKMLDPQPGTIDGAPVTQYNIELSVAKDVPAGQLQALVSIRTTDDKRVMTVSAMGEVVGSIAATPARVQLGGLTDGQPVTQQVRIASRNGKAFKILSVEDVPATGTKFFSGQPSIIEDTQSNPPAYLINLSSSASGAGSIRGELVITTDSADDKVIKVPYFGFIRTGTPANKSPFQGVNPAGAPANAWQKNPSTLIPQ